MAKELVSGEYCYVGNPADKEKRIWLGCFNDIHVVVYHGHESTYMYGNLFGTNTYKVCTPIEDEPEYYYIWEKVHTAGYIMQSELMTDALADKEFYKRDGWVRNDSTKRLPLGVSGE